MPNLGDSPAADIVKDTQEDVAPNISQAEPEASTSVEVSAPQVRQIAENLSLSHHPGTYENRCTALTAVNICYGHQGGKRTFLGRAFFMYCTPQIASFALYMLNGRKFKGRAHF